MDIYHSLGVSLLIWDYRGFGWATGDPSLLTLGPDVEKAVEYLPTLLAEAGLTPSHTILLGRSIGSICAIHAAHVGGSEHFSGLILENGIFELLKLPMADMFSMMLPGASEILSFVLLFFLFSWIFMGYFVYFVYFVCGTIETIEDPFEHEAKLGGLQIPLMVLHSMKDEITPFDQGKLLHSSAVSTPFRHFQVIHLFYLQFTVTVCLFVCYHY